jgi:hypothetical protein
MKEMYSLPDSNLREVLVEVRKDAIEAMVESEWQSASVPIVERLTGW